MAARIRLLRWQRDRPEAPRDLHVVPGQVTRDLVPDLEVVLPDGLTQSVAAYLAANVDATLGFQPLLNSSLVGDRFESPGLRIDRKTGVVEMLPAPPATIRNFVIEIELGTPGKVYREVIRVQVHRSVSQAWLTPPRLTVPIDSDAASTWRFTVRAQFDDNVVGDLTVDHGVIWHAPKAANVTAEGFLHPAPGDKPNDELDITAELPARFGGLTTPPAKLRIGNGWNTIAPRAMTVVGGGTPSVTRPEKVPNVLFVSDGFTPALRGVFESSVDLIVKRLATSGLTSPYDLLATSMNFWRVFLPSETTGLSCRQEFYTHRVGGSQLVASPLEVALRPPDSGAWTLQHLLYAVGLPVPADAMAGAPLAADVATRRAAWTLQVHADHRLKVADKAIVADSLVAEWMALATRTFIDELDGFPGVALGEPPAATVRAHSLLRVHPDRGGDGARLGLLDATADIKGTSLPGGQPLGKLWQWTHANAFDFNNTRLIVVLSSYPGGRPLNYTTIALGTEPQWETFPVNAIAGRNAHALMPLAPSKLASEVTHVIAHELGHSFGLGDEYQEFNEKDPQYNDRELDAAGNLQYESELLTGPGGSLRSEMIKWNWHRIVKAAVIRGTITPAGAGFRVPLAAGHPFKLGDRVLLRLRTRAAPLGRARDITLELDHEAEVIAPLSPTAVVIKAAPGRTLVAADLARFTAGCVIYSPLPAAASAKSASYPYAELVAKNIRDHIDTGRPLTRQPCELDRSEAVYPLLAGVAVRKRLCGLCTPNIVGLYSGGHRYACGVYHPTGSCVMAPGKKVAMKSFCMVCRYVLVDFIDPRLHGRIDSDYETFYPQP